MKPYYLLLSAALFIFVIFFIGCPVVDPDFPCINEIDAEKPTGVDSLEISVICGNAVVCRYVSDGGVYCGLESEKISWDSQNEATCSAEMNVFCSTSEYDFFEYEFTLSRKQQKRFLMGDYPEGTELTIKNNICGTGLKYFVLEKRPECSE